MRPLINLFRTRAEQEIPLVEARVNGGMVTAIDPADLENNQFVNVRNYNIVDDRTVKRPGHRLFDPAQPTDLPVLLLTNYKKFDNTSVLLRFTSKEVVSDHNIHKLVGGAWVPITGVLNGSANDRFSTTIINNRFFFANGIDKVQEIDSTLTTHADAGNWGEFKFLTGFFNRVVAARRTTSGSENPVEIGWSGDLNFGETDPFVDFSAGFEFLVESPSDYNDFITGLVGFPAMLLIPKERSIWIGTKQPSASNPFLFNTAVPGIGCDCPYSIQKIPSGIAWFDYRTASVYAYTVGQQLPTPIGRGIEKTIVATVSDLDNIFSDYNSKTNKYRLAIPSPNSNTVRIWCYDFRSSTWTYDEMEYVTCINSIDYVTGSTTYDELIGSYDSLVGSYDSLSNPITAIKKFVGNFHGDIVYEDETYDKDEYLDDALAPVENEYGAILDSKIYEIPDVDQYVTKLVFEYICKLSGVFVFYYSKDGKDWVVAKTVNMVSSTKRQIITFKKNIKCRQLQWRIGCNEGLFELISYEIKVTPGGPSKSGQ